MLITRLFASSGSSTWWSGKGLALPNIINNSFFLGINNKKKHILLGEQKKQCTTSIN